MAEHAVHSEVVEAEGHLIDSQILNVVFDTVVKRNASFDVLKFDIGRSNDEPSSISMRISAPTEQVLGRCSRSWSRSAAGSPTSSDALLRPADRDGCVPDDFYSTTNHRTLVRHGGQWIEVERQRMDAVIVVEDGRARVPQAARRPDRRRASSAASAGVRVDARVPGARSPRLRVHDERDLVGAARRGRRRAHRGDDARGQGARRPDRRRRRSGRRAHRRRRRTFRS